MSFLQGQPPVWVFPPDWKDGVRETLTWATTVHRSPATGATQHVSTREWPRRVLTFTTLAAAQAQRILQLVAHGRRGARWRLPVWMDAQRIANVHAGADTVACRTLGYDFAAGGAALLYRDPQTWEVMQIADVHDGMLVLSAPVLSGWEQGATLYPLRWARLHENVRTAVVTDDAIRPTASFLIDEPCAWPAELPATSYRGHPVLADSPDWGEPLNTSVDASASSVDSGAALPFIADGQVPLSRSVNHVWELWGRQQQARFRALLYALRGRSQPVWVPTWCSDLRLIEAAASSAAQLRVEWAGYALYAVGRVGLRDIRIELWDGRIVLRRIVAVSDAGAHEVLQLDQALGLAIVPRDVRRISFMALSTLASDEVEIEHTADSDGRARVVTAWNGVPDDV